MPIKQLHIEQGQNNCAISLLCHLPLKQDGNVSVYAETEQNIINIDKQSNVYPATYYHIFMTCLFQYTVDIIHVMVF